MTKLKRTQAAAKKTVIGILGGIVVILGIIMIPYPGPGWVVVFLGLGILSTEFDWAKRLLDVAKGKYDAWQDWLARQAPWIKASFWIGTCLVVITTIWLLNGYGIIANILHLDLPWVHSPLPIFK